jgi:PhoPQ-activated pathogenicity-related protein
MFSVNPARGDGTALDRYVAASDSSYRYSPIATIPGDGYTVHILAMASQQWRNEIEVDRPLWKHWLTIIEPEQVAGRYFARADRWLIQRTTDRYPARIAASTASG